MRKTFLRLLIGVLSVLLTASVFGACGTVSAKNFTVNVAQCENGTLTADKPTATFGEVVTLTATPSEGYSLEGIYLNGELLSGNSFKMPASEVTVSAVFSVATYQITVANCENGTLTADKESAIMGEVVTLTATPSEGYILEGIYLNGELLSGNSFEMPASDITVSAVFSKIVYQITIVNCENGTLTADKSTAADGEIVTLTATPSEGYSLEGIYLNGELLSGNSFEMPASAVTVSAVFSVATYQITIADCKNGTLTADKSTANVGEVVTLTATPATHYKLSVITVNGKAIDGNSFTMTAEDVEVNAEFVEIFAKGENIGYTNGLISTSGVDVSLDSGGNPTYRINGSGEQYAYYNDVYAQKLYHKVEINVEKVLNNDAYPKFGIILESNGQRVAFYVAMTPQLTASAVGRVYYRDDVYVWSEESLVDVGEMKFSGSDYITLAIARDEADLYLYVNDSLVLCEKNCDFLVGNNTALAEFSFNTVINARGYTVLTADQANETIEQARADYMRLNGETYGSSENYKSSAGVDMSNDRGSNPYVSFNGKASPQYAYLQSINETNLYYEADFNIVAVHNDPYPKFGLFAQIEEKTMFFYVDMKPELTASSVGVVYVRKGAWDWNNARSTKVSNMAFSGEDSVKLAIMRDGTDIIFLVNGAFALMVPECELADNPSVFGAFAFNTEMTVSNTTLDQSAEKALEIRKLIPRVGMSANGVGYCLEDYIYDYDTNTITLSHANSTTRAIATLYENGMPILTDAYVVEGTLRIYNTKTSGGAASKVELQVGKNTSNFLKFLIYRYGETNNSLYIEGTNQQGGGNIPLTRIKNNVFPGGTDWTVDYKVIFDHGTVYFILDDEVQYIYETGWNNAGYSFGVLQYADTVWTNIKATFGSGVADAVAQYKDEYLVYKNATENGDDFILASGNESELSSASFYRAGANLIINNPSKTSSASAYLKNANGIVAEYRLSLSKDNKWMIERIVNGESAVIVAPENKTYGWMDFEVALSSERAVFMLNGRVYDTLSGNFESVELSVGAKNCSVTVHNAYAQQFESSSEAENYIDSVPVYLLYSSYSSRINSLYKEYITEGEIEKGGVLILGSSTMDFWDNWATDLSLTDKITGYNVGIGGTTSEDWLTAYDKLVKPFYPSCVLIFVGGNDINVNGARGIDTAHRVQELIERIHADFPAASIYYIYSLPTPNSYANGKFTKEEFSILVNTLKAYCDSKDYVVGVDVAPALTDENGNPIDSLFRDDKIHMTLEGYALWTNYLLGVIEFPENLGKWFIESEVEGFESHYATFNSVVEIDFSSSQHAGKEGLTVNVTDEEGNQVAVIRNGDVFSFVMPLSNVTVTYFVSEKYTNEIVADSGVLINGVYTSKNIQATQLLVPEHYANQSLAECYPVELNDNAYVYGFAVSSDGGVSFGSIITDPAEIMLNEGDVLKVCFVLMGSAASGNSNFNVSNFDGLTGTIVLGSDDNLSSNRYWGSIYQNGSSYRGNNYTLSFRMEMSKPSATRNYVAEIQVSNMPAKDVYRGRKVFLRFENNATVLKRQFTETLTSGYNAGWTKTNTAIKVSSTAVLSITVDVVIVVTPKGFTITVTNANNSSQVYTEEYVHSDTKYAWENVGVSLASVQIGKVVVTDVKFTKNA